MHNSLEQIKQIEQTRQWLDDFDAQVRNCPAELRKRERAKVERERQERIIAKAEAYKREQRATVDNQEAWDRYVDSRIAHHWDHKFDSENASEPHFGRR